MEILNLIFNYYFLLTPFILDFNIYNIFFYFNSHIFSVNESKDLQKEQSQNKDNKNN
jgi:hypothetical protein